MDFNAIYHRANDNYCYPLNEEELIINIKTGYFFLFVYILASLTILLLRLLGLSLFMYTGRGWL